MTLARRWGNESHDPHVSTGDFGLPSNSGLRHVISLSWIRVVLVCIMVHFAQSSDLQQKHW